MKQDEGTKFPEEYISYLQDRALSSIKVQDWFKRCMADYPTRYADVWDKFVEDMKDADAWYDVLDSPDIGNILNHMFDVKNWKEKWFGQFETSGVMG